MSELGDDISNFSDGDEHEILNNVETNSDSEESISEEISQAPENEKHVKDDYGNLPPERTTKRPFESLNCCSTRT